MDIGTQAPPSRIVAFGASAGGLQALRPLVRGLQPNGETAYLLAHHLAPDHPSNLAELLQQHSALSVSTARHGEALRADHLYVCPPGQNLEIQDDRILLLGEPLALLSPSADRLFSSLAEHAGARAIAVILSGSGHDGTIGGKAVNAAGGIVIAQLPDEAVQPGMPEAAIRAGVVDLVGSVEKITAWLNEPETLTHALPDERDLGDAHFSVLFRQVSESSGLDLAQYKENTLRRQTIRRYQNLGFGSLEQYVDFVAAHPDELAQLHQSYMISVSSFFRDPEAFAVLEEALRTVVAGKRPGDAIRVWVPGSATGEEPYSIAMLLCELLGQNLPDYEVRIFATDIDQDALEFARAGVYQASALESLDILRRQRWFFPHGSGWRVAKEIRDLCVFSAQDVTSDPPFIRMDLISCRNLLIYLKADQQNSLIRTFHYGLNPDGLLLLGKSESAGFKSTLFEAIDQNHKLYRRSHGVTSHPLRFARPGAMLAASRPFLTKTKVTSQRQTLVDATANIIAREFGPPGVLVNASFEPLHFFGRAQRYFMLAQEDVDFSIFALCPPALSSELKALCYRLVQENLTSLEGGYVQLAFNDEVLRVKAVLRRIEPAASNSEFALLICFDEARAAPGGPRIPAADAEAPEIAETNRLRQELADTREHLQAVIEELEASNEELLSLNEEIQSSSEELQASNEELQSSNEELTTLNDELRSKSQEAIELNETLSNVQNSIRTSLVVVDQDGRITRYNALATRIFGLVSNDVGQFLYGVPCHLRLPSLREQVDDVIRRGNSIVERVHQGDFHFLMQVDPYHNSQGSTAGAVLTFSDISELHRAEAAQVRTEVRFRQVWDSCLEGLIVTDDTGLIVLANPAILSMFGYGADEVIGRPIEMLVPPEIRPMHVGLRQAFVERPQSRRMARMRDIKGCHKSGREFFVEVSLSDMSTDGNRHILATVSDISARKEAEMALRQSEQRLRLTLDSSHAGSWEWDLASNGNVWSTELWRLYGLSEGQVEPSFGTWLETIHPADRPRILDTVSGAAAQAAEFEAEWQVNLPADAPARWLMARGRPIAGDDGRIARYIGIVIDITERKLAEAELAAHRNRLESLIEERTSELSALYNQAPCGYHSLDADGLFVKINDTELVWLGYSRDEMIGRLRATDIMTVASQAVFWENYPQFKASGSLEDVELEFIRKDGSIMPALLNAKAVYDDSGAFLYSLSTIIDYTDRKQLENAWISAQQTAEQANRAKSAFLANMSHEIRTPMNAVLGLAHLMQLEEHSKSDNDRLGQIIGAGKHLLGVINNILDLSKIEAGKLQLENVDFSTAELRDTLLAVMGGPMADKNLDFKVDLDRLPAHLNGDVTRLTQALVNYLGNALKFTEQGSVTLTGELEFEDARGCHLKFEVRDTGIGLSDSQMDGLFQSFSQADASTTRKYGGTGLGLSLTRHLAELMGGSTGARSIAERGSAFWLRVCLPRALGETPPAANPMVADALNILRQAHAGKRVLLVEDDPINQIVAQDLLDEAGLQVELADNGRRAVDMVAARHYDLVLMDMMMPEMDGLEAARALRGMAAGATVPIVAMTANAFSDDREHCLHAGMNDFISKPVAPDLLFSTVLRWLDAPPA